MAQEAINVRLGELDIGVTRSRYQPVLDQMDERGLHIARGSINKIRSGTDSGGRSGLLFNAATRRDTDDASFKNALYGDISWKIWFGRKEKFIPYHRFGSHGLVENVAEQLKQESILKDVNVYDVRRALMSMRADYISMLSDPKGDALFQQVASDFLEKHTEKSGNKTYEVWEKFRDNWDRKVVSMYEFFRTDQHGKLRANSSLIASWVPYEAAFLHQHYFDQTLKSEQSLSPHDRDTLALIRVIEEDRNGETVKRNCLDEDALKALLTKYPLRYDREGIITHLRALAYGDLSIKAATPSGID